MLMDPANRQYWINGHPLTLEGPQPHVLRTIMTGFEGWKEMDFDTPNQLLVPLQRDPYLG